MTSHGRRLDQSSHGQASDEGSNRQLYSRTSASIATHSFVAANLPVTALAVTRSAVFRTLDMCAIGRAEELEEASRGSFTAPSACRAPVRFPCLPCPPRHLQKGVADWSAAAPRAASYDRLPAKIGGT